MRTSISLTVVALCVLTLPQHAGAQETVRSVLYPAPAVAFDMIVSAGFALTILPRPIAEEEIRQIPVADVGLRFGLPYDFSVIGGLTTNGFTSSASLGAQWSISLNKYSLTLGDRHSFWYGTATIEGFDASALGWINHPYASIGVDYKEVRILLRAETSYVLYRSTRVGEQEVAVDKNVNAGSAFTLAIEQPFIDSTDVTFGLRLHFTDSAVQSWLAFTTLRDKLMYPELLFSVTL